MQAEPEQAQGAPPRVGSNGRPQSFLALNPAAKEIRAGQLLLEAPGDLLFEIEAAGDVSTLPLQLNGKQLIFSSRKVPDDVLIGTPEFEAMQTEMGELFAVLSCLNPATTDISLPVAKYYFCDPRLHRLLFSLVSPNYIFSMMTLAKSIGLDPFPAVSYSLNHCFELSYKIAEAVFFLYTARFLHKNIPSSSVVVVCSQNAHPGEVVSRDDNDEVYLMGFDLISGEESAGKKQHHTSKGNLPDIRLFQHFQSMWDNDVLSIQGAKRWVQRTRA
ncbi:hypothetical protein GGI42DRAFT_361296 [Trichoderma sp. SZMC 28013]